LSGCLKHILTAAPRVLVKIGSPLQAPSASLRLETRRFVLTASNLSFSIDRRQHTIPLDMLDLKATTTANHDRGIDLRIPADRTEISLSF
jgi:hypothetical protein